MLEEGQRGRPAARQGRQHSPAAEHLFEYPAIGLVVIHYQDRHTVQLRRNAEPLGYRAKPDPQPSGEVERATATGHALDPQTASHQRYQLHRDGQTQSGAAIPASDRAVGLGEGLEDHGLLIGRDTDARVLDAKVQAHLVAARFLLFHADDDFAVLGEFDGVADQVNQDLTEPAGVAHQNLRHVSGNLTGQLQAFLLGTHAQGVHDRTD